jgi:Flp pilus assembly pilin Flp
MALLRSLSATVHRNAGRFCADQSGATAIEYAMVASCIGAFLATTVYTLGGNVKNLFTPLSIAWP